MSNPQIRLAAARLGRLPNKRSRFAPPPITIPWDRAIGPEQACRSSSVCPTAVSLESTLSRGDGEVAQGNHLNKHHRSNGPMMFHFTSQIGKLDPQNRETEAFIPPHNNLDSHRTTMAEPVPVQATGYFVPLSISTTRS